MLPRRIGLLGVLPRESYKRILAAFTTSANQLAGSKWRLQQGLARSGNEYGPLTDIPDWSYADGRPTPLWPSEIRRREQQKQLAKRAVELMSDLKFAKKRHLDEQKNKNFSIKKKES